MAFAVMCWAVPCLGIALAWVVLTWVAAHIAYASQQLAAETAAEAARERPAVPTSKNNLPRR